MQFTGQINEVNHAGPIADPSSKSSVFDSKQKKPAPVSKAAKKKQKKQESESEESEYEERKKKSPVKKE